MTMTPRQSCINLACAAGGTADGGATARYWGSGDETVGSTNTGVSATFTTLAGGAVADFTITDTLADGFAIKPLTSGIYFCTFDVTELALVDNDALGISLDGALLTNGFGDGTAGMRAFLPTVENTVGGAGVACMIPISPTLVAGAATGIIRFMQQPQGTPEYIVYAQVQRFADFRG